MALLDGCSEGSGISAALLASLAWGTFGVPIKAASMEVEVNFFVMQSYKTIVCFVTSWLVIFLGEPVRWTPWGIVSGLFWVPGAACGIYGIRNAGVAVAVGTWSSIMVISSCIFGIIIFQESVKDTRQTFLAFFILMIGLVGMSRYSDTKYQSSIDDDKKVVYQRVASSDSLTSPVKIKKSLSRKNTKTSIIPLEIEELDESFSDNDEYEKDNTPKDLVILFGGRVGMTKREAGLLGAVINGAWGGLNLIPLHYAQRDYNMSGASYLISYATGSMIVCLLIWALLFTYHYIQRNYSVSEAIEQLPAWHVRELGIPGLLAGLFYSIGNFCSILAVAYLGQGVGFSFCQGSLLVSGLWGVFYFQEIRGKETIQKWFASAILTVIGIVWLSNQHQGGLTHR